MARVPIDSEQMQNYIIQWDVIKEKGRLRFALLRGVLPFGLLFFVLFGIILPFVEDLIVAPISETDFLIRLLVTLVLAYFFGYAAGIFQWKERVRKYEEYLSYFPRRAKTPWDMPTQEQPEWARRTRPGSAKQKKRK